MMSFSSGLILGSRSVLLLIALCAPADADPRRLSQMPDPRGEFIRLCAPFMVSRYAHPEAICDCLRTALRGEIGDSDILDAVLYGITERGVPSISSGWLPREKRPLINHTMTEIAEPTMQCMFGNGQVKKPLEGVAITSFAPMPPVQTLEP
jgi:hypothetical protein